MFVRDNAGWMLNSARRMLAAAPAADAQDFVQEALVLLLQKRPKLPAEAAANAWLHRTLVFMIQNHLKKQRRRERLLENQPANDNPAETLPEAAWRALDATLDELPDAERELILGRFYRGLSWDALAASCGKSADTLRKQADRVLEKLREKLGRRGIVSLAALSSGMEHLAAETKNHACGNLAQAALKKAAAASASITSKVMTFLAKTAVVALCIAGVVSIAILTIRHTGRQTFTDTVRDLQSQRAAVLKAAGLPETKPNAAAPPLQRTGIPLHQLTGVAKVLAADSKGSLLLDELLADARRGPWDWGVSNHEKTMPGRDCWILLACIAKHVEELCDRSRPGGRYMYDEATQAAARRLLTPKAMEESRAQALAHGSHTITLIPTQEELAEAQAKASAGAWQNFEDCALLIQRVSERHTLTAARIALRSRMLVERELKRLVEENSLPNEQLQQVERGFFPETSQSILLRGLAGEAAHYRHLQNHPHLAQEIIDEKVDLSRGDGSFNDLGAQISLRCNLTSQTIRSPLPEWAAMEVASLDLRMAKLEAGDLKDDKYFGSEAEWILNPSFSAGGVEMQDRWGSFTPEHWLSKWISESEALRQKAGEALRQQTSP